MGPPASRACRSSPTWQAANCPNCLCAVPEEGRGARRAGAVASAWAHRGAAAVAVLFQQHHRQSVRYLSLALHYLIFDGVLEPHLDLKILAVHGGGYLGALFVRARPRLGGALGLPGQPAEKPTHYLKKVYFDTVVFTPHQLRLADRQIRRRPHRARHRLSVRHGGIRADRAPQAVGAEQDIAREASSIAQVRERPRPRPARTPSSPTPRW